MMMAPHQSEEPTDQITFSMDSGACWHTIQLGEAIDVIGIRRACSPPPERCTPLSPAPMPCRTHAARGRSAAGPCCAPQSAPAWGAPRGVLARQRPGSTACPGWLPSERAVSLRPAQTPSTASDTAQPPLQGCRLGMLTWAVQACEPDVAGQPTDSASAQSGAHGEQPQSLVCVAACWRHDTTPKMHPRRPLTARLRRVEPTASSHIFLVYGEACFQDERHLSCTHTQAGERPAGKMFALDLAALMGNEFKVTSTTRPVANAPATCSGSLPALDLAAVPCDESQMTSKFRNLFGAHVRDRARCAPCTCPHGQRIPGDKLSS